MLAKEKISVIKLLIMLRIMLISFLCFFSFSFHLSAKIIEAIYLEQIQESFHQLDDQSLVIWDVDHTLIFPSDSVLRPGNEAIAKELRQLYIGEKSREKWIKIISQVLSKASYQCVDPQLPSLIASLHKKNIPTMAFTAMRTGSYGIIHSMENWRINQLKCLGIDFSHFFPQHSELTWQEPAFKYGHPTFKAGILCSDHLPKGPVLKTFLKFIHLKPTQVVFIDDTLACLVSVENIMNELNVPFIGIHYQATKQMQSSINIEIAHYQYLILAEKGIWLTDAEALVDLQGIESEIKP